MHARATRFEPLRHYPTAGTLGLVNVKALGFEIAIGLAGSVLLILLLVVYSAAGVWPTLAVAAVIAAVIAAVATFRKRG
jgi:hypothetical protein